MMLRFFSRDLAEADKRKFLLFLTGSDRIPIRGMESVRITIQKTKVRVFFTSWTYLSTKNSSVQKKIEIYVLCETKLKCDSFICCSSFSFVC